MKRFNYYAIRILSIAVPLIFGVMSSESTSAQAPPAATPVLSEAGTASTGAAASGASNVGSACGQAPCNSGALPFPGPSFDPYSTSNNTGSSLFTPGQAMQINDPADNSQTAKDAQTTQRLLDAWLVRFLWMSGGKDGNKLGLTQLELNATFAFPLCFDPKNSLKVTPGFVFNWWNTDNNFYYVSAMPNRTYDAYCDLAWAPSLNDWISADLAIRIGVYSDFHSVKGGSIRLTGHGYGVFQISKTLQLKLGVEYVNRVNTKILPAGGVVWTNPEGTKKLEAIFPYPKYSQKCTLVDSKAELWWYVRGEYGGGTWNVYTSFPGEEFTNVSYNDIRIAVGLDFEFINKIHGFFEIGGAFNRELVYQHIGTKSEGDSFFLSGGLYF